MKKYSVVLLLIAVFTVGMAGAWFLQAQPQNHGGSDAQPLKESTFDRVMRTQTIRCGYVTWEPFLVKDPNTGKFSGLFYDYAETLGQALHLKIEWTEESTWGDFPAALDAGRFDVFCGGGYPNSARARVIDFVRPIFYQPIYAYVRANEMQFDNNIQLLNDHATTIVAVEGSMVGRIVASNFPKANALMLPELTNMSDAFVSVSTKKADATLSNSASAELYNANNPGQIRRVVGTDPIYLLGNCLFVPGGQDRFRRMLDAATDELIASGEIEKIITKYERFPDTFLRVAKPYQTSTSAH